MIKDWRESLGILNHSFQLRVSSERDPAAKELLKDVLTLRKEPGEVPLIRLAVPVKDGTLTVWTWPADLFKKRITAKRIRETAEAQERGFVKYVARLAEFKHLTPLATTSTLSQWSKWLFIDGLAVDKREALAFAMETERKDEDERMASAILQSPQEAADADLSQASPLQFDGTSLPNVEVDVDWIRKMTGFTTEPFIKHANAKVSIAWQKTLLDASRRVRYSLIVGSRQMGKTYFVAEMVLEHSFLPGQEIMVVSISVDSATQTLRYLREFMRNFPHGTFQYDKARRILTNAVSGSHVCFRTVGKKEDAERIRGATVDLMVVDEAALIDNETFQSILEPTLDAREGKLFVISTPRGKNAGGGELHWFFEMYAEILAGKLPSAFTMKVTFRDNPVLPPARRAVIESKIDRPNIRREYCCEFVDGGGEAFDPKRTEAFPKFFDVPTVLAYDPGRKQDRAGYSLRALDAKANRWVTVVADCVPDSHKGEWSSQIRFLKEMCLKMRVKPLFVMDGTGVGDAVAEIARTMGMPPDVLLQYVAGDGEDQAKDGASFNLWRLGKSLLLAQYQDGCSSGAVQAFSPTCGKLFEEAGFAELLKSPSGQLRMKSPFFDDVLNADMVGHWAARKFRSVAEGKVEKSAQEIRPAFDMRPYGGNMAATAQRSNLI